jgi:Kelch motif protein
VRLRFAAALVVLAVPLLYGCAGSTTARATPVSSPSPSASPIAVTPSPLAPPAQRAETPLPLALEEAAAASAAGKLYVIGGFDAAGNSLRTVWVFDGSAWRAGSRLPLGLDHTSAATLGDRIYVAGGHSFGRDSARAFRLDGSTWTELAPMHHARGGHTLLAAMGRLYAIGGNTAAANVAPVEVYDPATGAWSDLTSFPTPRNHVAGFVLGNSVCAAGGRSPTRIRVDCFDLDRSAWVRLPDLPIATSGAGASALADGRVVIMGGQDARETNIVNDAELLGPNAWAVLGPMLVPRHGFELAPFDGRAWACGGGSLPGLHPVVACTSVG